MHIPTDVHTKQAKAEHFAPDWSELDAARESLREHMAMVKELREQLAASGVQASEALGKKIDDMIANYAQPQEFAPELVEAAEAAIERLNGTAGVAPSFIDLATGEHLNEQAEPIGTAAGVRATDADYRDGYRKGYRHGAQGERPDHRVGLNPYENGYCDGYKDGRAAAGVKTPDGEKAAQQMVEALWARQAREHHLDDYRTGYHDALTDFANMLIDGVKTVDRLSDTQAELDAVTREMDVIYERWPKKKKEDDEHRAIREGLLTPLRARCVEIGQRRYRIAGVKGDSNG
jgi:hypothetical protein